MPAPVQAAMIAALDDHEHVAAQVATYRARRERLLPAAQAFGLRIDGSQAGLYLWASADEDCWRTLERLADLCGSVPSAATVDVLVVGGDLGGQRRTVPGTSGSP